MGGKVETEEEKVQRHFLYLEECFPNRDPEFLYEKARHLYSDEAALNSFVDKGIESQGKNFPTRGDYEKRRQQELLLEKYSKEFNEYAADDDDDLEEYVGELLVIQDAMRNLTQWKSSAPPLPPTTLKTAMSRWRNPNP